MTDHRQTIDASRAKVTVEAEDATEAGNRAALYDAARAALQANRDFLALASPSNAQNAAQVKALTRQVNGLGRLVLGALDGTD